MGETVVDPQEEAVHLGEEDNNNLSASGATVAGVHPVSGVGAIAGGHDDQPHSEV